MKSFGVRLYIAGKGQSSKRAVENLREILKTVPGGLCDLEVVDILEGHGQVHADHVFATPMLVRYRPGPTRRILGDLGDRQRVLTSLGIEQW